LKELKERWSRWTRRLLGLLALAASLFYLGRVAVRHAASLPSVAWTPASLAALAGATGLYLLALLAGALAWFLLLRASHGSPPLRAVLVVCALGQAAKYVPGNVGQYLGRAVLARRHGVSLRDSAFTLVLETGGLILAAAACAAFAAPVTLTAGGRIALLASAAMAAPCLLILGARFLDRHLPAAWRAKLGAGPLPVPSAATLAGCLALYAASFCCGGGAVHLLARGLFAAPPVSWTHAIPAFAFSWVAGFVTPGAPGGLGVREALLVGGTAPLYGPATALSTALALRGVSVLGDGLAFLAGLVLRRT
jgi:glycosyltransferase 2 family protein